MTLQIYTHRSAGRDQAMAQSLGELIQAAIGTPLAQIAPDEPDAVPDDSDGLVGPS